jgi:hypothetical protein
LIWLESGGNSLKHEAQEAHEKEQHPGKTPIFVCFVCFVFRSFLLLLQLQQFRNLQDGTKPGA